MSRWLSICRVLVCILLLQCSLCAAQNPKTHLPNNLDDIVDNEEDEDWKQWGKPKEIPIPFDLSSGKMNLDAMQTYTQAKLKGPATGFVKLRPDPERTMKDVKEMARQWTQLLTSGYLKGGFHPSDKQTMTFKLEDDRDLEELGKFMLNINDIYEFKFADTVTRRKGDQPLSKILGKDVWAKEKILREEEVKRTFSKPPKNMADGDLEKIKKLTEESERLQRQEEL